MHKNEFIIKDYDVKKPFASFLPGIAGLKGIPLWCHYTNRTQAITSFGLRDKNGCILEFYPANSAFRIVDKMGFRTFVKIKGEVYEPFRVGNKNVSRTMHIAKESITLNEINEELNLETNVTYFILPNENIAGLTRIVSFKSLKGDQDLEIIDGITQLLPTDANEWMLKHQSNLLKSWMDVTLIDDLVGFYFENSIPSDSAEVKTSSHGNYYISVIEGSIQKTIYDLNNIFGYDTSLNIPIIFTKNSVDEILKMEQVAADKVSGGFTCAKALIKEDQTFTINTLIGYTETKDFLKCKMATFKEKDYFERKFAEAKKIIDDIVSDIETSSNDELFDEYMKQNYLDNILRGGIPYFIDTKSNHFVYHLYSRRHGDMEREYNFFTIAPEFYSQGNGNFRDVCQNRRSDNLFHKEVGIFNAKMFAELIQLDGYNPLSVQGLRFKLKNIDDALELSNKIADGAKALEDLLRGYFTPGAIINLLEKEHIKAKYSDEEIFQMVFELAESDTSAAFGEGYWVDHWTYLLDLVENVENIEPDAINDYLYNDFTYRYYNSPVTVLPRSEKYVLTNNGKVRQYGALLDKDFAKRDRLQMDEWNTNWQKDHLGNIIKTNLYSKLISLAFVKFTLLDPFGIGLSMEANKPGWNDAMNGLPGIFASGVSETIELARLVDYLIKHFGGKVILPQELIDLINETINTYQSGLTQFALWDEMQNHVEAYRDKTRFETLGMDDVPNALINELLALMKETLSKALQKALEIGDGIYPTFLAYDATRYELLNKIGHYGLPLVKVNEFKIKPLPLFLEAPARSMKYIKDQALLRKQYALIKKTELYDQKLKMYKTSVSLDNESYEIGRIRAFQKGWLERESNFLHMTYKYLLGLLKAHMYEEFFEEIKTNFTCNMSPDVYGRSVLENSSFIATSNNPDPYVHGTGFVARLSGSTAEALSMWNIMMFGHQPFILEDGMLTLNLKPILTSHFFKEDHTLTVKFLSKVYVTYHFDKDNTFDLSEIKYVIDGITYDKVNGKMAERIRDGLISQIDVYLK